MSTTDQAERPPAPGTRSDHRGPAAGSAPPPGPPGGVRWAYAMVIVATLAAIASNVFEIADQIETGVAGAATTGDLVLTIAFCALFGFFAEMLRAGRQWGRVLLTVFTSLGIVFTGLGLAGLGGRPLVGALQGSLAVISLVTSVVGLVLLFLPSVNRWMSAVRRQSRTVPQRLRKIVLTAHVAISVGWLGLVTGMFAMSVSGATTGSAEQQAAMYRTMSMLDEIFLGMTSMFALITGIVVGAGTKWGLLQRRWVAVKFFLTMGVMILGFGVIHQLILRANELVDAGAPVRGGELDTVGWSMAGSAALAVVSLVFMTAVSTYKPWGPTRWGKKARPRAAASRTDR
ncbi:hypothetical protein OHB37_14390 [Streptomyces albidoflavus]|nr:MULTISPECIES: hypothetical protein [Streptomyces]MBT2878452.1 hypothetical protein [Streptomyces sp. McG6]MBT2891340.1 hypothetical protein [Streptomyces sp. McG2]MBV7249620.1 hypothetical protein [Streptomyces sp. S-2]WSB15301.1 hypothetical protein OHB37_14390 [Streptomyces albidoflavus]